MVVGPRICSFACTHGGCLSVSLSSNKNTTVLLQGEFSVFVICKFCVRGLF
jgi:hypothetical protein